MSSNYPFEILKARYLLPTENSWEDCIERVATHISKAEENSKVVEWKNNFIQIMREMDFVPGGRILYGAGRKNGAMLNCFALDVEDNRYSIARLMSDMYLISAYGGGVGINYSKIRPKGFSIQNIENLAPGVVSEIRKIDAIGEQIKCGGARRVALLAALSIEHPDIIEFLEAKVDHKELNNHNISVLINNDFIKAVKKNKDWNLQFGNKITQTVSAKELWNRIILNSIRCGEPGIIFEDNIKENFAASYFEEFVCTNPCGEIPLSQYGACCLGSINLANMYDETKNDVNWSKLSKTIKIAVRFLDDVITMNQYPLPETKTVAEQNRRIGLGVMGLHYLLIKMGLKYGKQKSLEFLERLFATIRNEAFEASIELANEKGSFPKYDFDSYTNNNFIKMLPTRLIRKMKKMGIRNSAILTCPPTGTTSLLANVSSGIEPIFAPIYKRKYYDYTNGASNIKEEILVDKLFYDYVKTNKPLTNFVSAYDITPEEHIAVQATIQQFVDGSISKTINLPEQYDKLDELSEIIFEYSKYLKGLTIYRQGSRGEEPLKEVKFKTKSELNQLLQEADSAVSESKCRSGVCEL